MTKVLKCADAGFECDAVFRSESEDDLLAQAGEHAMTVHGVKEITDDIVNMVKSNIKEE